MKSKNFCVFWDTLPYASSYEFTEFLLYKTSISWLERKGSYNYEIQGRSLCRLGAALFMDTRKQTFMILTRGLINHSIIPAFV